MRKLLAVTAREVRERWLFVPVGLVVGFMPFVLWPALGLRDEDARFLGAFNVLVFMVAAAVVAGSSMLARDAADGRLGFLFSRPVPWPTIWGAKWVGAVLLAVSTGIAAALPMLVMGVASWHDVEASVRIVFLGVALVLGAGVANFCATAFRSRSPWVVVDLALAPTAVWLARRWAVPVLFLGLGRSLWLPAGPAAAGAAWLSGGRLLLFVAPILVALLVGSAFQVALGRTDLVRAHRAMSIAFWAIVLGTLGLAGLRLAWARAARPADLAVDVATPDPVGRWIYVAGPSRRGGVPELLVDTAMGRYIALGPGRGPGPTFSADGRFAARLLSDEDDRTSVLGVVDLSRSLPHVVPVALESSPPPTWRTSLALSPSGAFVLLVHETGASLFETSSGVRVATTTLAPGWRLAATRFLEERVARIWLVPSGDVPARANHAEMRVLDLARDGSFRAASFDLGQARDPRSSPLVAADREGRRLLTDAAELQLRDGATGALLATLGESSTPLCATFLTDGRIVVGQGVATRTRLRVFDRAGALLGETTLDVASAGLRVGPEVAPGRVAVAFARYFPVAETFVVDATTLEVVERLPGLLPAGWLDWRASSPSAKPANDRACFFQDAQGRLIRIDFATGERKVVAGPGAPEGDRIAGP